MDVKQFLSPMSPSSEVAVSRRFKGIIYSKLLRFVQDDQKFHRQTRSSTSFGFLTTCLRSTWYHSLVLL